MRVLAERARGGEFEVSLDARPRPYFLIEGANGTALRTAERLLPLEGGRNFRDLGGYATEDGRAVRWGRLYRSGVMANLTDADLGYLAGLGVKTVCDLRSAEERTGEPAPFAGPGAPDVAAYDYAMSATMSSMGALFAAQSREDAVRAFSAGYLQMAEFLAPNYADMFARLVRREAPLAVNCSAGKDRTGVASALILSVLGVPRETVIADYALSETFVTPESYIAASRDPSANAMGMSDQARAAFARLPEPVLRVLMGSDADVMRLTLAAIDAQFGGPVALAKARYGLDDSSIAFLRATYLV